MALEWKDGTSYSRDKERVQHCWTADIGGAHLAVLNNHKYFPGKWVAHFGQFFDTKPLGDDIALDDVDAAKARALEMVRAATQRFVTAVSEL